MVIPDKMVTDPPIPISNYCDGFGSRCSRILAPIGRLRLSANGIVDDTGEPDAVVSEAHQNAEEDLPDEALVFLLPSRYCETDQLSDIAWSRFAKAPPGWGRDQAICDHVYQHFLRLGTRPRNPDDFSAWFEAYLGDAWYTFDARHNAPRIGRILIARGRCRWPACCLGSTRLAQNN